MSKLKRERVGKIGEEREKKRREENRGGKYTYLFLYAISVFFFADLCLHIYLSLSPKPTHALLPIPFFISVLLSNLYPSFSLSQDRIQYFPPPPYF
jgi:hypothetical protein